MKNNKILPVAAPAGALETQARQGQAAACRIATSAGTIGGAVNGSDNEVGLFGGLQF